MPSFAIGSGTERVTRERVLNSWCRGRSTDRLVLYRLALIACVSCSCCVANISESLAS
jgi:hypothetical protein